ncbi:MAG: serine/threonine protein kinase [Sandaracinaceae bacterium]|nr:serine/threonine protein kinase [Sandaracinaceae bacterium]
MGGDEARTRLERRLAALGVTMDAPAHEPDATIRPPGVSDRPPDPEPASTTGPFLPSITLAEPGVEPAGAVAPTADLLVGEPLGEGGMGVVHGASQRSLDRDVAIKRPLGERAGVSLIEEARTMARVEHPNVVPVHTLGRDRDGRPVLVMKRVSGASLRDLLKDDAHRLWPLLEARWGDRQSACLGVLADVADALERAHARGVVHRDVKPENVMVGEFGEVYLLDWGIAQRVDAAAVDDDAASIAGTPGFMAPEMVLAPQTCDARTDVYLLGATLHQILTGTLRHRGPTYAAMLLAAMASEPVAYGDDVPEDLAALANAATSLDRDARPESAAAFRRALLDHERHKEALGLARAARAALEPLRAGTIALADDAAAPPLFEARSLLAAAARAHPDGAEIARARAECVGLAIARDLAIDSPASARALLAELPAPHPALEAAVAQAEARLARAKDEAAALRRAREEADTSSAFRVRAMVLGASFAPILLVGLALPLGLVGGASTLRVADVAWTNLAALGLLGVLAIAARRWLLASAANRTLTAYSLGTLLVATALAFAALALDTPLRPTLTFMHLLVVGFGVTGAITIERAIGGMAVSSAVFAALLVALPEATDLLSALGLVGVISTGLAGVLAHARRTRAERLRADAPPEPR